VRSRRESAVIRQYDADGAVVSERTITGQSKSHDAYDDLCFQLTMDVSLPSAVIPRDPSTVGVTLSLGATTVKRHGTVPA
jgi:hypothetical protein